MNTAEWPQAERPDWQTRRLRFVLETSPSDKGLDFADDDTVSFVPMDAVGERGGLRLDQHRPWDAVRDGYTYFKDNDVVVAKITPCFENGKGALAESLTNGVAYGTTELHVLRSGTELDPRFLFYLTLSHPFRKLGEAEMYGAGGQKRVPERFIKELRPALPDITEQQTVARFLDYRTAQLDRLIEKKRQLLDKLAEKRSALITRAVTKGLDPDAPMKDSGVPWLGEIPAHWRADRSLKYLMKSVSGCTPSTTEPRYWDGYIPWVSPKDMKCFDLDDSEDHVSEDALAETSLKYVPKGTVLIVVRGMILAHTFPVALNRVQVTLNQDMKGLQFIEEVLPRFCGYVFRGAEDYFLSLVDTSAHGTKTLRTESWVNAVVPVPPLDEQHEIVDAIDTSLQKLSDQGAMLSRQIDRLSEYRSALITAAVTGQIDVRGWRAPETSAP